MYLEKARGEKKDVVSLNENKIKLKDQTEENE